jgi:ABC-2 type transport system ATP-binding protein
VVSFQLRFLFAAATFWTPDYRSMFLFAFPVLWLASRSLSLGQRMRAELAAAVLPAPEVLFLDEPTIGLDVEAKAAVRDFLRELNRSARLLAGHEVPDLTLEEPDIEDIVRRIYRGETPP